MVLFPLPRRIAPQQELLDTLVGEAQEKGLRSCGPLAVAAGKLPIISAQHGFGPHWSGVEFISGQGLGAPMMLTV